MLAVKSLRILSIILPAAFASLSASCSLAYPVTIENCFEAERFDAAPKRALVNDMNMVQTIIDLGLADRFVGVSGIAGVEHHLVGPPAVIAGLHQFVARYPTLEAVLAENPDFMFAGWNYGFSLARGLTPKSLAAFGVASYTLRESCIRIGRREPVSMETLYADLEALGAIFDIAGRTQALIAGFRARVAAVVTRVASSDRPRVMYCSDCDTDGPPFSVGAEGMTALITRLAGGTNIFDEIPDSYVRVSWEQVIRRDPQWILISNHDIPVAAIIEHLTTAPELSQVEAVRKRHFIFLSYAEQTASTRSVDGLEKIARALHPDRFRQ